MSDSRETSRLKSRVAHLTPIVALFVGASIATSFSINASAASLPAHHHVHRGAGKHNQFGNSPSVELTTIFSGTTLGVSDPDDITTMDGQIFVGFQNGVGPQGQPSSTGNLNSTIVELSPTGVVEGSWSITGKCDGLTADQDTGLLIATVNEDLNSSLYTIDPTTNAIVHYGYSASPLLHNGGTDAISIVDGSIYISASAPGTVGTAAPDPAYPAVYAVALDSSNLVATVTPAFYDGSTATVANVGSTLGTSTSLALTDPDSNEVVPHKSPRFAGDFVLDSQGDLKQIYVHDIGQPSQSLSVLTLSQSIDDSAWATSRQGSLYITDSTDNLVDVLRGRFDPGTVYVAATPCGSNSAPGTCPAPPEWPANYLATLDLNSGTVTPVDLGSEMVIPQGGLLFVPRGSGFSGQQYGDGASSGFGFKGPNHSHHSKH